MAQELDVNRFRFAFEPLLQKTVEVAPDADELGPQTIFGVLAEAELAQRNPGGQESATSLDGAVEVKVEV